MSKQYREIFVVGQVQNGPYRELDRVSVRVLSSGYESFEPIWIMETATQYQNIKRCIPDIFVLTHPIQ